MIFGLNRLTRKGNLMAGLAVTGMQMVNYIMGIRYGFSFYHHKTIGLKTNAQTQINGSITHNKRIPPPTPNP